MAGIVYVHGTGMRQDTVKVHTVRSEFVEGLRSGLLAINSLDLGDVGSLLAYDPGLGPQVRFAEFHAMGSVPRGARTVPGRKRTTRTKSLRWQCECCLSEKSPKPRSVPPIPAGQKAVIRRYYPQLDRFLDDTAYRDALLEEVRQEWPDGDGSAPDIVVAHSMGSVVALSALARWADLQPKLFVTLGSPLAFETVYRRLGDEELSWAEEHSPLWLNVHDKADTATNTSSLPQHRFPEVLNLRVRNGKTGSHKARKYLGHKSLAYVLRGFARNETTTDSRGGKIRWEDVRPSQLTNNNWNPYARPRRSDTKPAAR